MTFKQSRSKVDFSIIICTRNRAHGLAKALEFYTSISTQSTWELVVVDNNSTDNTGDIIRDFEEKLENLRYLICEKVGLGAAREMARSNAKGDILIFTDDDCYPESDFIESYKTVFSDQSISYAGGRILLWDKTDAMITVDYRENSVYYPADKFMPAGVLKGANMAVRRHVLDNVGGFDPELGAGTDFPCEDIDVIGRLSFSGYAGCYSPLPVIYHHHGRKEADKVKLSANYDKGRGAYYAKMFFFNRKSCVSTTKYFLRTTWHGLKRNPRHLKTLFRELCSGLKYCFMRVSS